MVIIINGVLKDVEGNLCIRKYNIVKKPNAPDEWVLIFQNWVITNINKTETVLAIIVKVSAFVEENLLIKNIVMLI